MQICLAWAILSSVLEDWELDVIFFSLGFSAIFFSSSFFEFPLAISTCSSFVGKVMSLYFFANSEKMVEYGQN